MQVRHGPISQAPTNDEVAIDTAKCPSCYQHKPTMRF